MVTSFHLEIVSVDEMLHAGAVHFAVLPGEAGALGVLPGHEPLVTRLRAGMIRFQPVEGGEQALFVAGGVLDIERDRVTVLADHAMRDAASDAERAEAARRFADQTVAEQKHRFDYGAAEREFSEDLSRFFALVVAEQRRSGH
ncbi:ATP synthase F1 subunit epsilon [Chitinasiproducens palmae]|uniref:ATP synthase epsilon chain n=1 Tax=Chitinasiproducens palmae TaxID=1770053 RepID=A0A1H2PKI8_9BURK|nr:ATP synthase F1 subunit epsilon [Chitinasiproducens palmae]SDV46968.1 ATP synthase F1 subcomplex epsilon subunit [Chitinasiproducens palmae]